MTYAELLQTLCFDLCLSACILLQAWIVEFNQNCESQFDRTSRLLFRLGNSKRCDENGDGKLQMPLCKERPEC